MHFRPVATFQQILYERVAIATSTVGRWIITHTKLITISHLRHIIIASKFVLFSVDNKPQRFCAIYSTLVLDIASFESIQQNAKAFSNSKVQYSAIKVRRCNSARCRYSYIYKDKFIYKYNARWCKHQVTRKAVPLSANKLT